MSSPIITVDGIGKAYRIGLKEERYPTLRDALVGALNAPLRRFQQLRERTSGDDIIWALKDVSFEVHRGEVLGIIGRNGAGKTTILKILSRITEPTEGTARLRGRVASLLEVGTGFHPELSGRENVYLNGAILGMKKAEIDRKFDEIVAFAGVERFIDTPVKRYSSGMYVRLAFAVAAHLDPEILIVDEVLAVGDLEFQKKCLGKMHDVAAGEGRTVLFVSHNMDAIMGLCSHVIVTEQGHNSERLSPEEGVSRYLALGRDDRADVPLAEKPRIQYRARPPIFTNLTIRSKNGDGRTFPSGDEVTFEIELRDFSDIVQASCHVALLSERYQRVAVFHTLYQCGLTFNGDSRVTLTCRIPSLPLTPGRYYVELALAGDHRLIERVERAAQVEVLFRDLFGTGMMPKYSQGHIALPCTWAVSA